MTKPSAAYLMRRASDGVARDDRGVRPEGMHDQHPVEGIPVVWVQAPCPLVLGGLCGIVDRSIRVDDNLRGAPASQIRANKRGRPGGTSGRLNPGLEAR